MTARVEQEVDEQAVELERRLRHSQGSNEMTTRTVTTQAELNRAIADRAQHMTRVCWRCGRWGTRGYHESGRSDAAGVWECANDRACNKRATTRTRPDGVS